MSIFKLNA